MKTASFRTLLMLTLIDLGATGVTLARDLTFEDRVKCQESIERVYYSHQIGATRSFDEAVSLELLKSKVQKYLKQAAVLEKRWSTSITSEMLQREMLRQAAESRMPQRLGELYKALGSDPQVILECLVRQALVRRLTHNFYTYDTNIHSTTLLAAQQLRELLANGQMDPNREDVPRTVVEFVSKDVWSLSSFTRIGSSLPHKVSDNPLRLELSSSEFMTWKRKLPNVAGDISPILETNEGYEIWVTQRVQPEYIEAIRYFVAKRSQEDWWGEVEIGLKMSEIHASVNHNASLSDVVDRLVYLARSKTSPSGNNVESENRITAPCDSDDTWDNGGMDDSPEPRNQHKAVWTGSEMLVWGGWNGTNFLNSGGRYDPATDTWLQISTTNAPSARYNHTAVWTGTDMVVWGGHSGGDISTVKNTGGRYDPTSDSWASTSLLSAPSARSFHTAVWTGTRMIVWGGMGVGNVLQVQGGIYDPGTDTWSAVSTIGAPAARTLHTAIWTGSRMVVWGGNSGPTYLNSGGRYDPITNTWLVTSLTNAPIPRTYHSAIWTGTVMIIWGGSNGTTVINTGSRYDPGNDRWSGTATINAPSSRSYHTAVWTDSKMVVWGGDDSQGYLVNTGGAYDPANDNWLQTPVENAPTGRYLHTVVWTGSMMIVWGGHYVGATNTGGRYDPVSGSWTPTSTGGAPSARQSHTVVWTGNEMIVWGGWYITNTGGRYDPASDDWYSVSITGAPSARREHRAVWTGNEMVIWGGVDKYSYLNSGGRYNPISDSWRATSTTGAPVARTGHTAVFGNSRVLIWGGWTGSSYLNSGAQYDPDSDFWMPISSTSAPIARRDHVAVWTGSAMVVWGGWDGAIYMNSGGRYDAVNDSWSSTTTSGAPSSRIYHTAIWDGRKVDIWGGYSGSASLNSGSKYDPLGDTWSPMSSLGAPSGRYGHTSIWTGRLMVIWGGWVSGSDFTSTGARYDPEMDTWLPTSVIDAPTGRYNHSAIWSGSMMIVWGGSNGQSEYNIGGRYSLGHGLDDDGDGFSECTGDCNDNNSHVYPGAPEICDGIDNQCAGDSGYGLVDEGLAQTSCGVGACVRSVDSCVNGFPQTCIPGTPTAEVCNGIDDDCNGVVDDGLPSNQTWYRDEDGDGHGDPTNFMTDCHAIVPGYITGPADDCNDTNSSAYPGAKEVCDYIDNDCNGPKDEGDPNLDRGADSDQDGMTDWEEVHGVDGDGDGIPDLLIENAPYNADCHELDVFVEIDHMNCSPLNCQYDFEHLRWSCPYCPSSSDLSQVATAFSEHTVEGKQVQLHLVFDEEVPYTHFLDRDSFLRIKLGASSTDPIEQLVCEWPDDAHFSTSAIRHSASCTKLIGAWKRVFRYAVVAHEIGEQWGYNAAGATFSNNGSQAGFAVATSSVQLASNVIAEYWKGQGQATSGDAEFVDFLASTFMHELGHSLGLQHGGGDGYNCKPHYNSIMNQTHLWNRSGKAAVNLPGVSYMSPARLNRQVDYSSTSVIPTMLYENALVESNEFRNADCERMIYACAPACANNVALISPCNGLIDWNNDQDTTDDVVVADVSNVPGETSVPGDSLCATENNPPSSPLSSFNDWQNLHMALPTLAVARSGVLAGDDRFGDNNEASTDSYLNGGLGDTDVDGDGVSNVQDSCPLISNATQIDSDGDGYGDVCDCLPEGSNDWGTPGEAREMILGDVESIQWMEPRYLGTIVPAYDVIRSDNAADFVVAAECMEDSDGSDTSARDPGVPGLNQVYYYVVRAKSECPGDLGTGPLGTDSAGRPRGGRTCP